MSKPLFLLIDGHSLAFRSYYALAKSKKGALRTSTGIPTSVCFGFLNSLLQVIESKQPEYVAIAFDLGEPTFRHEADANYKANRTETPEDFLIDVANLQQLLEALNFSVMTFPGYEADDVIATLAQKAAVAGYPVQILSGDRDLFQLINPNDNISVLYLEKSGQYREFDTAAVEAKMGIKPDQVVDYKALCGDKSDNIPGVLGIGDKTAVKLLKEYKTLDQVYDNLGQIKGAMNKKLAVGKEAAYHSQKLAQLVNNVPLVIELEECQLTGFALGEVQEWLEKLELKTFLQKIHKLQARLGGEMEFISSAKQLSLFETQPSINISPQIIDTKAKLENLTKLLANYTQPEQPVAWDTETTSLDTLDADLVGIGCCWGSEVTEIAYIPIGHNHGNQLDKQEVLSALKPILENPTYPKVLQNTKFDRLVLRQQGIKLAGVVFDTLLASYLLHPEESHKLADLCQRYLQKSVAQNYEDLGIAKDKNIADLDIPTVAEYCGLDVYGTLALFSPLGAQLAKIPNLYKILVEVEQPLEPILAEMEYVGIGIDKGYFQQLSQQVDGDFAKIEQQVYQEAGEEFNIGSPKQLAEVLFDKLGLDKRKSRQTKTGYSTDHGTLEKLQGDHAIIEHILEYRTLAKLKSTYIDVLPNLVKKDGRVHTNFNQTNTATGRLSSSNPNLQNIPIRTAFSRQIRQGFIPADNWLLVSADYSQIESRILAHLSQEPVLLEAYRNNEDIHSVTAKLLFDKEEITSEERRLGKIINFGVIYGMGAQKFAREAGVSSREGKEFIAKYHAKYSQVFAYLERLKKDAIAFGFVTTILGRRRNFNFVSESLKNLRDNPEDIDINRLKLNNIDAGLLRAAANAPIQGSSADIIKVAMVKLDKILQGYQARLLLQVHDELVIELPREEWEELQPQIKSTMETAINLSVPLVVDINSGSNWMETK